MRLPRLSPSVCRTALTTTAAPRGRVEAAHGLYGCGMPCALGFACPKGCVCDCNPAYMTSYQPEHFMKLTRVGCMCVSY